MDETYIRVKGEWRYLYRAVDKYGNTIDFLLRAHRDKAAARRYFETSIAQNGAPEGLGWIGALSSSLALLVFAAGFCMSGAQTGLNAFAPGRYPTVARATGVSWMLGMGRFGSIFGSAIGGALLGLGWEFGAILSMLAVPATLAAIAIMMAQRTGASEATAHANTAH